MPPQLNLQDIRATEVRWLWPGFLPQGKLVVLDGDPGCGKSTITLDLAARVTAGKPMPLTEYLCPPSDVVLINSEDGLQDTITPRMLRAGANLRRAHHYAGLCQQERLTRLPSFPRDTDLLAGLVAHHQAALVVIDPFTAYLDDSVSMASDQSVRTALMPLADVAERTGACILLVRHLNKGGTGKALYRGLGSIGVVGTTRQAFVVVVSVDDPVEKFLVCTKANLTALPPVLVATPIYDGSAGLVQWRLAEDFDLSHHMPGTGKGDREEGSLEIAMQWLSEQLRWEEKDCRFLEQGARAADISRSTLKRAARHLGVVMRVDSIDRRRTLWGLPSKPY